MLTLSWFSDWYLKAQSVFYNKNMRFIYIYISHICYEINFTTNRVFGYESRKSQHVS